MSVILDTRQLAASPIAHLIYWISFFIIQVSGQSETLLTVFAIIISILCIYSSSKGEIVVYLVGLAMGLVIEVGMGLVLRTQHWTNASFFGVPFWLPLIWGYGFVILRRVGNLIVSKFD
jgi:hypothetical protein